MTSSIGKLSIYLSSRISSARSQIFILHVFMGHFAVGNRDLDPDPRRCPLICIIVLLLHRLFFSLPMFALRYGPSRSLRMRLIPSPTVLLSTLPARAWHNCIARPSPRFVAQKKTPRSSATDFPPPVERLPLSKCLQRSRSHPTRFALPAT